LAFIIGRGIRNGYTIRDKYLVQVELKRKEAREANMEQPSLQEDPMADFLGKTWWTLPATVVGAVVAIWKVLEWLDLLNFIIGSTR